MLTLLLTVAIHVPAANAHVGYAAMDLDTGRTLSRYAETALRGAGRAGVSPAG